MTDLCAALKLQVRLPAGSFVLDHTDYGVLDISTLGGDTEDAAPFILDQSRLDADFMALPGDDPNSEWVDLVQFVQSIEIERGAKSTQVGYETEVGLATFVFIGPELDPNQNTLIMPGAPMRLMTADDTVVFTGTIRNVRSIEDKNGLIRVTISAHDLIGKLANIKRYGADQMTFIERIDDLLVKHAIPYNRLGGAIELARTDYESNLVNHLQLAVNSEMGEWWVDRQNIVQVRGMGAKKSAYSSVTFRDNLFHNPGLRAGSSSWFMYAGLTTALRPAIVGSEWLAGAGREGRPSLKLTVTQDSERAYNPGFRNSSIQNVVLEEPQPGEGITVVPGQSYMASGYMRTNLAMPLMVAVLGYRNGVKGYVSYSASASVNSVPGEWMRVSQLVTIPANVDRVVIMFQRATASLAGDVMELSDALFETGTQLGAWFDGDFPDDLVGDTQTRYGWYGRAGDSGSYKVVGQLKPDLIRFSNNHSEDPNHACYTDIVRAYDSSVIVNELKIDNRQWDAVGDKGETVSTVYVDETSRVTWGPSQASIEMNIDPSWAGTADNYAAQIIEENKQPRNQITGLTWNATEDMERAAAMEPFDFVFVEFENEYYVQSSLYTVLGVKHEISGDLWLTTLTLDEVEER